MLVFRIARKKIHQNFQIMKYDIKHYSDAAFKQRQINLSYSEFFIKQFITAIENIRLEICLITLYLNSNIPNLLLVSRVFF